MVRLNALHGALIADAAAMGLHWIYDQDQITNIAATGPLEFRQPDISHYLEVRGYFAHASRQAGELSHYGESARLVGELALAGSYSTAAHRDSFMRSFGPAGSFCGYADRPTKALIAKILSEGESLHDPTGEDDDQHPALCVVPGLFAADTDIQAVRDAVGVLSINPVALEGSLLMFDCLQRIAEGQSLGNALSESAAAAGDALKPLLQEALSYSESDPIAVSNHFGLPCHIPQGLPICWHLLAHAESFEQCVKDNIRIGGDSCGRAMALGAIAGAVFDIPKAWIARLAPGVLPSPG